VQVLQVQEITEVMTEVMVVVVDVDAVVDMAQMVVV